MLQTKFEPFPILESERLVLRKIGSSDAPQLFELRSDEKVMRYIDRPIAKTLDDVFPFIAISSDLIERNEGIHWAICFKNENLLVANICLWHFSKEHFRVETGYSMLHRYWGQGIMSEAIQLILKYAFENMNANTVEADINPLNFRSATILERNGFLKEAHFKEKYFWNGKFRDSAVYVLLKSNWTGQ